MTDSGVSKKVFVVVLCINHIAQMAADVENKLYYAGGICLIGLVYWICQSFIDWKKNAKNE